MRFVGVTKKKRHPKVRSFRNYFEKTIRMHYFNEIFCYGTDGGYGEVSL